MKGLKSISNIQISDEYILPYLTRNADKLLIRQWEQMNERGYIDNFRVTGMGSFGYYRGPLDADGCLHLWARTALIVLHRQETEEAGRLALTRYLEEYIHLAIAAQDQDGYLYTYKQIFEPSKKWKSLYAEREWLCMSLFIETAIVHYQLTEKTQLLNAARKCADLLLSEFGKTEDTRTAAFPSLEKALFLLSKVTDNERYSHFAKQLLTRRNRQKKTLINIVKELFRIKKSEKQIQKNQITLLNNKYSIRVPRWEIFPEDKKRFLRRSFISFLTGEAFQLHPRKSVLQKVHGSAQNYLRLLRAYLEDPNLTQETLTAIESRWNDIILNHAFITGGVGVNAIWGSFEKPNDLPHTLSVASPSSTYEMLALSAELYRKTARLFYIDFCEWIFFNLVLTSVNSDKDRYFSRNLHESTGNYGRKENPPHLTPALKISEAFALFPDLIIFQDEDKDLYIDQYVSCTSEIENLQLRLTIKTSETSAFHTEITVEKNSQEDVTLFLRIPGWAMGYRIQLDGKEVDSMPNILFSEADSIPHFFNGNRFPLNLTGKGKWLITIEFPKIIRSHYPSPKLKKMKDCFALSRGKFLYCAEEADNRHTNFDELNLNPLVSYEIEKSYDFYNSVVINGQDFNGNRVRLVPFHLWNNRGNGKMKIWLKHKSNEDN